MALRLSARRRLSRFTALSIATFATASAVFAQNPAATINANANRHPISPLIYGANWADTAMIADFNSTKAGGAESMITIPLVDWLAKLGPKRSGLTPYRLGLLRLNSTATNQSTEAIPSK